MGGGVNNSEIPGTWCGGRGEGGCILVIPEVRGAGGGVKYGSLLWYGMDLF